MKGGFELYLTVGVVIFAIAIVTILITVQTYYIDFAGVVKIPIENIQLVEASHAAESCLARLSANERLISEDVLEEYDDDSINRICEIQEPIMEAEVKDIESNKKYSFPTPSSDKLKYLFPPAAIASDLLESIRRYYNKQIKIEHSMWVSIAIPEVKKITDKNTKLNGEFLVQAKWEGLGSLKANDVVLKLYSKNYYKSLPVNVQTIPSYEVRKWLEDMEDEGIKFDSRIVDFHDTPVTSIIPHELVNCDKIRIFDSMDSETCMELFEKIDKIHMGRLGVKI